MSHSRPRSRRRSRASRVDYALLDAGDDEAELSEAFDAPVVAGLLVPLLAEPGARGPSPPLDDLNVSDWLSSLPQEQKVMPLDSATQQQTSAWTWKQWTLYWQSRQDLLGAAAARPAAASIIAAGSEDEADSRNLQPRKRRKSLDGTGRRHTTVPAAAHDQLLSVGPLPVAASALKGKIAAAGLLQGLTRPFAGLSQPAQQAAAAASSSGASAKVPRVPTDHARPSQHGLQTGIGLPFEVANTLSAGEQQQQQSELPLQGHPAPQQKARRSPAGPGQSRLDELLGITPPSKSSFLEDQPAGAFNLWPDIKEDLCQTSDRATLSGLGQARASPGSFCNFHIASGGQAQWRHLLSGRQMLILIPPLSQNLAAFAAWSRSPLQHACLLAHHCTGCHTAQHDADQTLFIPGGWATAVATQDAAIIISGAYTEAYKLAPQLKVIELEQHLHGSVSVEGLQLIQEAALAVIAHLRASSGISEVDLQRHMEAVDRNENGILARQTAEDLLGLLHQKDAAAALPVQPEQAHPHQAANKPVRRSISVKLKQHVQAEAPSSHVQGMGWPAEDGMAQGAPVSRRGRTIRRPARLAAGGDSDAGNGSSEEDVHVHKPPVGRIRLQAAPQANESSAPAATPPSARIKLHLPPHPAHFPAPALRIARPAASESSSWQAWSLLDI
ncbi:hypothetical protein WJX74_010711 [Apatococcus lobatus]|uniref:EF-hand domain-containing protein n=1 Tax=Apatococcus lobatus TaxID=904363 RepID=A0AAW1RXE9_9CHLO